MSGPDRNWTITPTLFWFGAAVGVGLCVWDGNMQAVADRFTTARRSDDEPKTAPSGPAFAKKAPRVADIKGTSTYDKPPPPPPETPRGDRSHTGALEDLCLDGTPTSCKRWGMDGFYKSVAQSKQGKLGRAVRLSWYGDSVIATDAIPARLRTRIQGELGNGGPGFVFIVPPHKYCHHQAITRTSWNGFNAYAISTYQVADGFYGPGGATFEAWGGNSSFKLNAGSASRAEVYYLTQPKGGRITLKADDGTEVFKAETAAADKAPGYAAGTISGGAKKFDISVEGAVRLFGIDIENDSGAVVDNLGIVSVNVQSYGFINAPHWSAELAHRNADLVMIMVGANEAAWLNPGDPDTRAYQGRYEKILAPIKKGRHDGACLVVSPTDQAYAGDGFPSRPVMPYLIEAQRKAALAQGCAFFSTYNWMGGKGSAAKWFAGGLVGGDFQHLTDAGANKLADAVYETLMEGYRRYATP